MQKDEVPGRLYSFSIYTESGFAAGIGVQENDEYSIARFAIGFFRKAKNNGDLIKFGLGLSYGFYRDFHIITIDLNYYKVFYPHSQFPFMLNGVVSPQIGFRAGRFGEIQLIPVFGLQYAQAIYAKNVVYPVIGIGGAIDAQEYSPTFIIQGGVNIRLDKTGSYDQ